SAVCASTKLPVADISLARRTPIAWASSTVSPQPGWMPTRAWVSAKRARSEATRKSQFSASSKPPVMAGPLIAPMIGFPMTGRGPAGGGRVAAGAGRRGQVLLPGTELLQVEAGAERRVGPGEDDDVDVGVGVGPADGLGQQPPHLGGQGVADLGAVEGHGGDAVGHLVQHDVGHAGGA